MKLWKLLITSVAVAVIIFAGTCPGLAATTRIAIVPFQINAEKDYTFLQKGIVQMLTSRLSSDDVAVVDPIATDKAVKSVEGMTGDSLALMAGAKLQADYVIFGSIMVLGESVSIDSKMLNITGTREPLHFFKQTPSMNEVIPQINLLATEINQQVFGRSASTGQPLAPAAQPKAPGAQAGLPVSDSRAHPEKLLQRGITAEGASRQGPLQSNPLNPSFETIRGRGLDGRGGGFWKSRSFRSLINGMDIGDVNQDGIIETVLLTPDAVLIYQFVQGRQQKITEIKTSGTYNISVDLGDFNGNGTPEIFITSYNTRQTVLASQVLEFDGKEFKPVVELTRMYFRVVKHPARGDILLGQRQLSGGANPLSSPIFELVWENGAYSKSRRILPGRKANLLGLSYGDFRNDQDEILMGYNESDKLRLYAMNGEEIWTSAEHYGGSPVYFSLPKEGRGDVGKAFFLPVRTRLTDLDGDQKMEALVVQNIDTAGRKLERQRFYKNSRIMALSWDGLGLMPAWRTRKISGRIQDLAVADFDNDGEKELVAAVVSKEGSTIAQDAKCVLIAYDLKQGEDSN